MLINLNDIKPTENSPNGMLSIMQPYFFPYIGYFQLIAASEIIVFYDDVSFIKQGWINRNRILSNKDPLMFTVPLTKASSNKLINEVQINHSLYPKWKKKFLRSLEQTYSKAPNFKAVFPFIEKTLHSEAENIADLAIQSIVSCMEFLEIEFKYIKSSVLSPETQGTDKVERITAINKQLGYSKYINVPGGMELYNKPDFLAQGIELFFIEPKKISYQQFKDEHNPWLSIIDVMMFNSRETVKEMLQEYSVS